MVLQVCQQHIVPRGGLRGLLLFAKNWWQAGDLRAKSCANVLRAIRHKILDTAHYLIQEDVSFHKSAETGYLARNGSSDFGFVILEKLDEGRY